MQRKVDGIRCGAVACRALHICQGVTRAERRLTRTGRSYNEHRRVNPVMQPRREPERAVPIHDQGVSAWRCPNAVVDSTGHQEFRISEQPWPSLRRSFKPVGGLTEDLANTAP